MNFSNDREKEISINKIPVNKDESESEAKYRMLREFNDTKVKDFIEGIENNEYFFELKRRLLKNAYDNERKGLGISITPKVESSRTIKEIYYQTGYGNLDNINIQLAGEKSFLSIDELFSNSSIEKLQKYILEYLEKEGADEYKTWKKEYNQEIDERVQYYYPQEGNTINSEDLSNTITSNFKFFFNEINSSNFKWRTSTSIDPESREFHSAINYICSAISGSKYAYIPEENKKEAEKYLKSLHYPFCKTISEIEIFSKGVAGNVETIFKNSYTKNSFKDEDPKILKRIKEIFGIDGLEYIEESASGNKNPTFLEVVGKDLFAFCMSKEIFFTKLPDQKLDSQESWETKNLRTRISYDKNLGTIELSWATIADYLIVKDGNVYDRGDEAKQICSIEEVANAGYANFALPYIVKNFLKYLPNYSVDNTASMKKLYKSIEGIESVRKISYHNPDITIVLVDKERLQKVTDNVKKHFGSAILGKVKDTFGI